ncbi:MAG: Mur ligase family protein [Rhodocyclaceae bacterium]
MAISTYVPWRLRNIGSLLLRAYDVRKLKRYVATHPKPLIAVTGSVGKTTTCRMTAHVLEGVLGAIGVSGTQGVYIGGRMLNKGDHALGYSALKLVADDRCAAVVAEMARGGLLKQGLVFDHVDIGVLLNVYDNHLGLKGIDTREQLAELKSIVVRKATRAAVLNADDPACMHFYAQCGAERRYLVSCDTNNPRLQPHRESGGGVVLLDNGFMYAYRGNEVVARMSAADVPDSHGGVFRPAIISAMNVMAISDALDIPFDAIKGRLQSFRSDETSNPGRMNHIDGMPYSLWVTWADGPEVMRELARFFSHRPCKGRKRIMLAPMGNRSDAFIRNMADAVLTEFDYFICSDWENLRGRPPGYVAGLLASELIDKGIRQQCVHVASNHDEALQHALSCCEPDDVLLIVTMSGSKVIHNIRQLQNLQ